MLLRIVMDGCAPQYEADNFGHRPIQFFRNLLVELKLRKRLRQRVIMFDVNARSLGYCYDLFRDVARSFRRQPWSGVRSQLVLKSYGDLLARLILIRSSHQRPQIKGQRRIGGRFALSKLVVLRTESSSTAKSACSRAALTSGSQALRRAADSVWSLESLTLTAAAESPIVTLIGPTPPASKEKFTVHRFAAGACCVGCASFSSSYWIVIRIGRCICGS